MTFVNKYGFFLVAIAFMLIAAFRSANGGGGAAFIAIGASFLALGAARAKQNNGGGDAG